MKTKYKLSVQEIRSNGQVVYWGVYETHQEARFAIVEARKENLQTLSHVRSCFRMVAVKTEL